MVLKSFTGNKQFHTMNCETIVQMIWQSLNEIDEMRKYKYKNNLLKFT